MASLPPGVMPYHGPPMTPRSAFNGLSELCEVRIGSIIYILGRHLEPFCSHALYRVRVTENRWIAQGYRRIVGVLIDFKDSPVRSLPLEGSALFRVESGKGQG